VPLLGARPPDGFHVACLPLTIEGAGAPPARVVGMVAGGIDAGLNRIEPYRLVEYTSEQSGLAEARHERHFADDGGHGLAFRAVVEYLPQGRLQGLPDRVIFQSAVERAIRTTLANLDARFAARDVSS
jgi:hypothetical protein